ncbi:MAG: (deoxy)nucleoside triphosphate pyrophosphohydrolase [Novosphingobium sp.]|nr:(deoxy)nucleoside triphosphate pyrophosphohydrolase [Novosphingobium sp.]
MQQRRADRAHGGLWEFPGGKVEAGESPESAAVREIKEELGVAIEPGDLSPMGFASGHGQGGDSPVVILLYSCRLWRGEPQALDAAAIAWCDLDAVGALAMPPLDYPLWQSLRKANNALANPG